jgi:hypothetical protein
MVIVESFIFCRFGAGVAKGAETHMSDRQEQMRVIEWGLLAQLAGFDAHHWIDSWVRILLRIRLGLAAKKPPEANPRQRRLLVALCQ